MLLRISSSNGWTRQSPSWYQSTWQSSQGSGGKEPDAYKEWSRHDTRSHTTETGGASSSTGEKRSQDFGKKHKSHTSGKDQGKFVNITCEDLFCIYQKILNAKTSSLGRTYRTQTEANDKSGT